MPKRAAGQGTAGCFLRFGQKPVWKRLCPPRPVERCVPVQGAFLFPRPRKIQIPKVLFKIRLKRQFIEFIFKHILKELTAVRKNIVFSASIKNILNL
jgi:hypothetical protein